MSESETSYTPDIPAAPSPAQQNRHLDVGFSFRAQLRPHEGYRRYFEPGIIETTEIPRLFSGDDLAANFPSVRYAAGWAYAEHAVSTQVYSLEQREAMIISAEHEWQEAIRLTGVTYEMLPGRFLLWPCTKWRYKFAVDTVPTLRAIAHSRLNGEASYDPALLEQSRHNVNSTLRILMGKYAWTRSHYTDGAGKQTVSFDQLMGRLGAIVGVAVEGAALSATQLASNEHAVLPPSLRHDYAGSAAVDLVAYTTRNMTFSAQVKQRVRSHDRKKYDGVALVCAAHHMLKPYENIADVLSTIADDRDPAKVRQIGEVILKVMQGNQTYGCSPNNPRPLHTRSHTSRARTFAHRAA